MTLSSNGSQINLLDLKWFDTIALLSNGLQTKLSLSYYSTALLKKTEVTYQPAPGKPYQEPRITVKGRNLEAVDNFTYLGSTLSRAVNIDAEVNNRISKASVAFWRLREDVCQRRGLSFTTKLKVYRALFLTTLFYACETWTVYSRHAKQLNHFLVSCLRRLLHITWQDEVSDTGVLERAGLCRVYTLLQKAQARWAGHVVRIPDCCSTANCVTAIVQSEDRRNATKTASKRPSKTWASTSARRRRMTWTVQLGAVKSPQVSTVRKAQAASTATTAPTHTCPTCGRAFRARTGLTSHLRTHSHRSSP